MTEKLVSLLDDKRDNAGSLLDQLTPRERENKVRIAHAAASS